MAKKPLTQKYQLNFVTNLGYRSNVFAVVSILNIRIGCFVRHFKRIGRHSGKLNSHLQNGPMI